LQDMIFFMKFHCFYHGMPCATVYVNIFYKNCIFESFTFMHKFLKSYRLLPQKNFWLLIWTSLKHIL